ncbi:MAG: hypothetical protein ACXVAO_17240, partial [Vulcanimicrobiaceae bacterium]
SQASYQVAANNTTYNVQTLRPDQIQIGVTNYLPNGTLYVDPNTHVATAHVTGADGTTYVVTESPDSALRWPQSSPTCRHGQFRRSYT